MWFSCLIKKVYITDKECNLNIIEKNYEINKDILTKEVIVKGINWCDEKTYENITNEEFDYIICSECIWDPKFFQPLINTLNYYGVPNKTVVLFSYLNRKESDKEFFKLLTDDSNGKKWSLEKVNDEDIEEDYRADDITIYRAIRL